MQHRFIVRAASLLTILILAYPALAQRPAARKPPTTQPAASSRPADSTQTPADDNQPKRLIMTDGSYQDVVRWETKGDRIRYLSAERYEWEEVPKSMVDWAATEKNQKEQQSSQASDESAVKEVDAEAAAERAAEEARSPTIAPGLSLPSQGGVLLLDTYQGQQQLVEIHQNNGIIDEDRAGNILRSTVNPIAKKKANIELNDPHAKVQAHVAQPVIYLNVEADEKDVEAAAQNPDVDRFRIVQVQTKKDARVVGTVETSIVGKTDQKAHYIPSKTEQVSSAWVKVTPQQPLTPGEYAIVEMLGKDVNLYVWDFGVNPSAPANPGAWKPEPVANVPAQPTPQLQQNHPKP